MPSGSDEAFARYVAQASLARFDTVEFARQFQAESAQQGDPISLARRRSRFFQRNSRTTPSLARIKELQLRELPDT